jgi:hypothetical protein
MQDTRVKMNHGLPWKKQRSTRRRILFHQQIGYKFEEETCRVLFLCGIEIGHFEKWIRNIWEILKGVAGEGCKR